MAYEYDRFEREDGGGSFLMGLLAGTVLGAGLGMLFAPKAGSELRNQLGEQAGRLRTTAADGYQQASEKVTQGYQQATDKVSQIVDRGKEAYERARTTGPGSTSTPGGPGPSGPSSTSGGATPGNTGQFSGAGSSGGYSTNRT
jgi:gas vesicle protein